MHLVLILFVLVLCMFIVSIHFGSFQNKVLHNTNASVASRIPQTLKELSHFSEELTMLDYDAALTSDIPDLYSTCCGTLMECLTREVPEGEEWLNARDWYNIIKYFHPKETRADYYFTLFSKYENLDHTKCVE